MTVAWRLRKDGIFEVVDRLGTAAAVVGVGMLVAGGWLAISLGQAVVEYARFATWREWLAGLPGMLLTLVVVCLFGVPGTLLAFSRRTTLFDANQGVIRQIRRIGLYPRATCIRLGEVERVVKRPARKEKALRRRGLPPTVVDLILADGKSLTVAEFPAAHEYPAAELRRQLAEYLGLSSTKSNLEPPTVDRQDGDLDH